MVWKEPLESPNPPCCEQGHLQVRASPPVCPGLEKVGFWEGIVPAQCLLCFLEGIFHAHCSLLGRNIPCSGKVLGSAPGLLLLLLLWHFPCLEWGSVLSPCPPAPSLLWFWSICTQGCSAYSGVALGVYPTEKWQWVFNSGMAVRVYPAQKCQWEFIPLRNMSGCLSHSLRNGTGSLIQE